MKSILNDVNRLEKAWELFQRLVAAHDDLKMSVSNLPLHNRLRSELSKSRAFLEKYGDK